MRAARRRRPQSRQNMIVIVSSSLRSDSNSRILAREAQRVLEEERHAASLVDLRDYPLPLCDGGPSYDHPNVARLGELLAKADAILVTTPIYNFDASAAVKNLIELTGSEWEGKVVGFLCAAGGDTSYMSIMSLANSLMLDFRCVIVPRFVYAAGEAFAGGRIADPEVGRRVAELARTAARRTHKGGLRRIAPRTAIPTCGSGPTRLNMPAHGLHQRPEAGHRQGARVRGAPGAACARG
jgi:FMN reductase